jgi:hypothetical protein
MPKKKHKSGCRRTSPILRADWSQGFCDWYSESSEAVQHVPTDLKLSHWTGKGPNGRFQNILVCDASLMPGWPPAKHRARLLSAQNQWLCDFARGQIWKGRFRLIILPEPLRDLRIE